MWKPGTRAPLPSIAPPQGAQMKYNIHITHAAERDMANAYDYIDLVLKNPTAADKLLDAADEKIGALAEFPHKFEVVSDKLLSYGESASPSL